MKHLLSLIILSWVLTGCSSMMQRNAQYSDIALTDEYSRKAITQQLGKPLHSCKSVFYERCDTYQVKGYVFDSNKYQGSGVLFGMSWGLSELILFPAEVWHVSTEVVAPSDKKLDICSDDEMHFRLYIYKDERSSMCNRKDFTVIEVNTTP
ncbi:hypothetical protein [Algibacillus agarilyticus]|uniref:hypothetical protein n=1 Tax=Algibacillus agarilyticus TaxID=2234133 RepID=UPI0013002A66|nr:hypothetical protein [Algibacillus agarilyticus]